MGTRCHPITDYGTSLRVFRILQPSRPKVAKHLRTEVDGTSIARGRAPDDVDYVFEAGLFRTVEHAAHPACEQTHPVDPAELQVVVVVPLE